MPLTVLTFLLLGYGRRGAFAGLPAAMRPRMLACGLLVVVNQSFFLHGMEAGTPPAHGAILYTTTPVIVFLLSVLTKHEPLRWGRALGILLAFSATAWLVGNSGLATPGRGELLVAGGVLTWSVYTVLIGTIAREVGAVEATARAFLIGIGPIVAFAALTASPPDWGAASGAAWYGLFHLAVFTGVIAYSIWATGLKVLHPSQVAVFTNLQPPVATLIAMLFHAQVPQGSFWLVLPAALIGVGLVQRDWRKTAAATAGPNPD